MANFNLIRSLAREKKMSLKSLAQSVGISENGLQKILKDNITSTETLEKISNVLGVSPAVFFDVPQGSANAYGENSTAINGSGNITVPQIILEQLAEKDARIKELTDKLIACTIK